MGADNEYITRREFRETVRDIYKKIDAVDGRVWLIVLAIIGDAAVHLLK